jgi:chemotaxis protein histidine kinase CheA
MATIDDGLSPASLLREFGAEIAEQVAMLARLIQSLGPTPQSASVDELFRLTHTVKGSARMLGLSEMGEVAHAMEDVLAIVRAGEASTDHKVVSALLVGADVLDSLLMAALSDRPPAVEVPRVIAIVRASTSGISTGGTTLPTAVQGSREAKPARRDSPRQDAVRVPRERLDRLAASAERAASQLAALRSIGRELRSLSGALTELSRVSPHSSSAFSGTAADLGVRARASADSALALARRHARITNELADALDLVGEETLALRMRRMGPVLDALQRAARETARVEGKRVRVDADGHDVEVDLRVLDTVTDSLVQLVRNAVSHGIETPPIRAALGKPDVGLVTITATVASGRVRISVTDDGTGIDRKAVVARAVRLGLVKPEDIDGLADRRALDLIFVPGFTTRDQVTGTSGRGVGLDIVKSAVESVRGTVAARSDPGRGTEFLLEVPAALASIRVLLVEDDGRAYAFPMASVTGVFRAPASGGTATALASGADVSTAWTLRTLLGGESVLAPASGVLLRLAGSDDVIAVEQVRGDDEVIVRQLPIGLAADSWVKGIALASSGDTLLVVDPASLLAASR